MRLSIFLLLLGLASCSTTAEQNEEATPSISTSIQNKEILNHDFLLDMYADSYYPKSLVDKCRKVLIDFCLEIERVKPPDLSGLYLLSHAAANRINDLQSDFFESGSELETNAAECLAKEFDFISKSYGFAADVEELIATRQW